MHAALRSVLQLQQSRQAEVQEAPFGARLRLGQSSVVAGVRTISVAVDDQDFLKSAH